MAAAIADAPQLDMFASNRSPVLLAYGGGVDSTAMAIEYLARGGTIDHALMADAGAENPATYEFIEIFREWLAAHGVPFTMVRYEPKNFKNYPPYRSLTENILTNGTLPSIAFGFSSCSQKWKIAPQNEWANGWEPARAIWAAGGKVTKLIGYDCSPADMKRYAEREGYSDPRYQYEYPLREYGWTRDQCIDRIVAEGLPVPPKSACFFCTATKPAELHAFPLEYLRLIVLIEARAKDRLRTVEGLWRKAVKGHRGATPRPGAMTDYIREQRLLPDHEIDSIVSTAPKALIAWQQSVADLPLEDRPEMREWLEFFRTWNPTHFQPIGGPALYEQMAA